MTRKTTRRIAAGAVLVILPVILMAAIAAHVAGLAQDQAQAAARDQTRCAGGAAGSDADTAQITQQVRAALVSSGTVTVSGLTRPAEQLPNAKTIVATGIQMSIPARGQVVALATALAESDLVNLGHGDRDSLGLFQQRPSQGWGTREQILDPVYASTKFYKALKSVQGWEQMPVTVAAQKVQKSAYPDAYAEHEKLATALQQAIAPTLGSAAVPAALNNAFGSAGCTGQTGGTDYGTIPPGVLPAGYQIPPTVPPAVQQAIRWALGQLGTPYQWGGSCTNPHGSDPEGRCDCSSLMQRAYGVAGVQLTRTTYTQINEGRAIPLDAVQPGDLLFSEGSAAQPEHVAMALGDGLLVQAPRPGRVVEVAKMEGRRILAVRRVAS